MATITTTDGQTVIIGPRLVNGRSAYQVAVDNGWEGAEEQWVATFATIERAEAAEAATAQDVLDAQAWAESEGQEPGGAGTKSAKEWAGESETHKNTAATSVSKAQDWAEENEDVEVETGQYSAKHHALKSAASATASDTAKTGSEAAQTASEAARDLTLSYRDTAGVHATTAATEAANAAANSSGQNMTGLSATITASAVALAPYYNTFEDDQSDWVLKNSENHPRAVFPIATATSLLLYDATVHTAPLYRTFDFTGYTITDIAVKNGAYVVTTTAGIVVLDFITGELDVEVKYSTSTTPALPSNAINSLGLHLGPSAPYDRMGNRMPTIGVFSDGGASRINPDGTVVSSSFTSAAELGTWDRHGGLWWENGSGTIYYAADPTTASFTHQTFNATATGDIALGFPIAATAANSLTWSGDQLIVGQAEGLSALRPNFTDLAASDIEQTTEEYAAGWSGDVQGAWLSSTTAGVVTAPELVTNGDFPTDITSWSDVSGGSASISHNASGHLDLNGASDGRAVATQSFTTVIGETYLATCDYISGGPYGFLVGLGPGGGQVYTEGDSTGARTVPFVATGTTTYITARSRAVASEVATVDNISVKRALPDRTHNENHLPAPATTTITAIEAGSSVMWHELSDPVTVTLGTDISSSGALIWMQEVGGVPVHYVKDLSGVQDYVDGKPGTAPSTFTVSGADVTVPASVKLSRFTATATPLNADQAKDAYDKRFADPLGGSSDNVLDMAYDAKTDELKVLTSAGPSTFNQSTGVRTGFDATKAGSTLIDVSDQYQAIFDGADVVLSGPAIDLRVEAQRYDKPMPTLKPQEFVGDASTTVFELPKGMKATAVYDEANFRIEGDGDDYEQEWQGYRYKLTFAVAPANTNKITVPVEVIQ